MKNIFLIILSILIFSCDSTNEIVKTNSVGKLNSVLVVVDNNKWQGEIGDSIRAVLAKTLSGFPQDEPRFTLSQISDRNFNKLLKQSRSIVYFNFKDKNSFKILTDKYASPQRIVVLTAKDEANLTMMLKKHEKEIISTFNNSDIKSAQKLMLKKYWEPNTINTFKDNGISIKIPYAFLKVQDTLNYAYFRKDIAEGYQILQIYTIPIDDETSFNGENIITYRNIKGKQFVPGAFDGSYMKTEDVYFPIQYVNNTMLSKKTIETRGVWEMAVSAMAGPFLNYALLDKENNRIIVVEGAVYAPSIPKRNYLFEMEALLKTLEIKTIPS